MLQKRQINQKMARNKPYQNKVEIILTMAPKHLSVLQTWRRLTNATLRSVRYISFVTSLWNPLTNLRNFTIDFQFLWRFLALTKVRRALWNTPQPSQNKPSLALLIHDIPQRIHRWILFNNDKTKLLHFITWFPNKSKRSGGYHELTTRCAYI